MCELVESGYSCGSFPYFPTDEEMEIQNFIANNTMKKSYAIIRRTEAAERYVLYKKISYDEALEKLKRSKIFKKRTIGGIIWRDKINDEELIKECKERKEASVRHTRKEKNLESESDSETIVEGGEDLSFKIKEKIKKLENDILELEKNYKMECEKKLYLKAELKNLLK